MNRFCLPCQEAELPRRGGTWTVEEASIAFLPENKVVIYPDFTSGQAIAQFQIDYLISRGEPDSNYFLTRVRMSAPGEDNWVPLDFQTRIFWSIQDEFVHRPDVAPVFAKWRAEHSTAMPYQGNSKREMFRFLRLER